MKICSKHKGKVEESHGEYVVVYFYPNLFQKDLKLLVGKHVDVTVNLPSKGRSIDQNKLYWEMLSLVSEHTGHSKDYLHEFFRQQFLGEKIQIAGENYVLPRSTTVLTTVEFIEYLKEIRAFVLDHWEFDLPIE